MKKAEKYARDYLSKEILDIQRSKRIEKVPELTIYEKAIIYKYSNDGYESLNESLRISNGQNKNDFGKSLNSALAKLSNFEGLVYRGVHLSKTELEKYEKAFRNNKPLIEHTFVSTSKSRLVAMAFRGNVLFRIYSRTGKEIEKIAKFGEHNPPNEQEVLFQVNRIFRVLDITNQGGYELISMEEI